jgi:hypothetical protein
VYEQKGRLSPCSSNYEKRCRLIYQKGMEGMAKHQESLPTHQHNRFKGLNNGFTKDQVEERR